MIEFQEKTGVPPSIETTVFDFTNTTGSDIFIEAIGGEGTSRAEWLFYIDSVLKAKRRNNAAMINVDINFKRFKLEDTKNVTVNITHYGAGNQDFSIEMRYL